MRSAPGICTQRRRPRSGRASGRSCPCRQRPGRRDERFCKAWHLRSLQLTHLTDVASTDQHAVKPWFVGKLDFAPAVVDLASDGFPLVGGRLDVVGGQSVAALVYARRKHVINVFVWPSETSDAALRSGAERGYAWIRWTRRGMRFWAVSDVATVDLEEFARRLSGS